MQRATSRVGNGCAPRVVCSGVQLYKGANAVTGFALCKPCMSLYSAIECERERTSWPVSPMVAISTRHNSQMGIDGWT